MGEQASTPEVMSLTSGERAMLKINGAIGAVAGLETIGLLFKGKPIAAAVGVVVVLAAGKISGNITGS